MAESDKFEIKDNILIKYFGNEENITTPDGITIIGKYAFCDCKCIESIKISEGVEVIEQSAFLSCINLQTIVLPNTLKCIKNSAFFNCTNLTNIIIPDSVEEIGNQAFSDCISLQSITLPVGLKELHKELLSYCEKLESINIPNSVNTIEDCAFKGCSSLINIIVPNCVKVIGEEVFSDCQKLDSINLGTGVEKIGVAAFKNCSNLKQIEIPDGVQKIENETFYNCAELKSVEFSYSLNEIGRKAFLNCSNLIIPKLPQNIKSLYNDTFEGCNLNNIQISDTIIMKGPSFAYSQDGKFSQYFGSDSVFRIPSYITLIKKHAFNSNKHIIQIDVPKEVIKIEEGAFEGCSNLTKINIDKSNKNYSFENGILYNKTKTEILFVIKNIMGIVNIPEGIKTIPKAAFSNRKDIKYVNFPKSLIEIQDKAFHHCNNLCNIKISENVKIIGKHAFEGCLKSEITLPKMFAINGKDEDTSYGYIKDIVTVQKIDSNLNDKNSEEITLSKDITVIGKNAFCDYKNLEKINIPNSIFRIEDNAFSGCSKLKEIEIPKNVNQYGDGIFKGCSSLEKVLLKNEDIKLKFTWFDPEVFIKIIDDYTYDKIDIGEPTEDLIKLFNNDSLSKKTKTKLLRSFKDTSYIYFRKSLREYKFNNEVSVLLSCAFKFLINKSDQLNFMANNKLLKIDEIEDLITAMFRDNIKSIAIALSKKFNNIPLLDDFEEVTKLDIENINETKSEKADNKKKLKNEWKTKILDNGTLKIVNYKGSNTNITVPATIDNVKVSTIGRKAFSPEGRIIAEQQTFNNCIKKVTLSNGIKILEDEVFERCENISEITIPKSITNIGQGCFSNCNKLRKIELDKENTHFLVKDGILYDQKLKSILFVPKSIKGTITLLDGLKVIGAYTFSDCKNLVEVKIPESVIEVGYGAFYNCKNLITVNIPEGVTALSYNTFYNCSKLCEVTIPKNVTSIDDSVFSGTENLIISGEKGSYAEKFVKENFTKNDIYEDARESYWDMEEYNRSFISLEDHIELYVEENSWKYSIRFFEKN